LAAVVMECVLLSILAWPLRGGGAGTGFFGVEPVGAVNVVTSAALLLPSKTPVSSPFPSACPDSGEREFVSPPDAVLW
jgi:hypothetical protein